jgi:hypothetical protein
MTRSWLSVWLLSCLIGASRGQESRPADVLAADSLKATLTVLAADDMEGRGTPSPGLERAAQYLATELFAGGVQPGSKDGSYFHHYEVPGFTLDSRALKVTVTGAGGTPLQLAADQDVRLLAGSNAYQQENVEVSRRVLGAARARGTGGRTGATKPELIEVDADSPVWKQCAGARQISGARLGRGGAPRLLVRKGLLPEGELAASIEVPAAAECKVALKNVIGIVPGGARKDEMVMFSAHYDHIGLDAFGGPDVVNNGADDDGTGSTCVLHLAKSFAAAKERLPRTLVFVFFSGEESGFLGSRAFVGDPPVALAQVVADLNVEMVGRPEDESRGKIWITGRQLSDFESIVKEAAATVGVECYERPGERMFFGASDNLPLAQAGVVAHSISSSNPHHADYHKPGDEVQKIDFDNMSTVCRALRAAGVSFATREARPAYNAKGKKELKLP